MNQFKLRQTVNICQHLEEQSRADTVYRVPMYTNVTYMTDPSYIITQQKTVMTLLTKLFMRVIPAAY